MYRSLLFVLLFLDIAVAQTGPSSVREDTTLARLYYASAEKFFQQSKYDSSLFYYEKAAGIYQKLGERDNDLDLWVQYVKCCNGLGNTLRLVPNRLEEALALLNETLQIGIDKLGGNRPEIASIYENIAVVIANQGGGQHLDEYLEKSLAIRRQAYGEHHPLVAKSYYNMGFYGFWTDRDKKLEYMHKALDIQLRLFGENNLDVADSYFGIGTQYDAKGDLDLAIAWTNKALAIRQKLLGMNHPAVGHAFNNLGIEYAKKRDFAKAIECFTASGDIFRGLFGENHPLVTRSCVNLSQVHADAGDYDKALKYQLSTLDSFKKSSGENLAVANTYRRIAYSYMQKGDHATAVKYLDDSARLFRRFHQENTLPMAITHQVYGELYYKLNEFEKALHYFHLAILAASSNFADTSVYKNPPLAGQYFKGALLEFLSQKAQAFAQLYQTHSHEFKDLQAALSTYQLIFDLVDEIRSGRKGEEAKLLLSANTMKLYGEAIAVALQIYGTTHDQAYQELAFIFAERGKAAVLAQSLQESRAKQFSGIPDDLLEREKNLRINLAFAETEIQKAKSKTNESKNARILQLEDQYFQDKREYDALIASFEKSYARYYDLKYRTRAASVTALQEKLDRQTALIEFFVGDTTAYTFVVTRNEFTVVVCPLDTNFRNIVDEFANSFKSVSSKSIYAVRAWQLYRTLIASIEPLVREKSKWVIIPDGELFQIPFEALLTEAISKSALPDYESLPFLIRTHEISYHFSATMLLRSYLDIPIARDGDSFVGFAPVFSRNNGALSLPIFDSFTVARPDASSYLITRDGKTLDELKYSAQELWSVAQSFPLGGRVYLHEEASEENFKTNVKNYKYVHVATHGFINNENPKLSNLAFSQPQNSNAKEDGILYSAETYNLDLIADLLVLSACQTGAGKIVKGEGLMALTRGFFYSGARNIVASLWKVYDEHTSRLMVEFYRQIAAGKGYSTALREAKLKMIANPETAGPQSWAGFVLIGR